MPEPRTIRQRRGERGVTILLVAVFLAFVVVTFAALAIDLTALYSARGEARQAADAAALAGAKVLANSGFTSDPTNTTLAAAAQTLASQIATSVGTHSSVGGRQLLSSEVNVSFPNSGSPQFTANPQVSVLVRRTGLPTFFAKIWGIQALSVSATSTAEAYNPSNSTSPNNPPISPQCVKPWVMSNINPLPASTAPIFNPVTGQLGLTNIVGGSFTLQPAGCMTSGGCGVPTTGISKDEYYPALLAAPVSGSLPTCGNSLACTYEQTIAGCSNTTVQCNTNLNITYDTTNACTSYINSTQSATSCMIHDALGADILNPVPSPPLSNPVQMEAGAGNKLVRAGVLAQDAPITTSESIATILVVDNGNVTNAIGFLQVFVDSVDAGGNIAVHVLNAAGCGTAMTNLPVLGDGVSPVPVRLIGQ